MLSLSGTQLLLSIIIVLLGVTLIVIGIQLFFVLKDLRKSLARTERILADAEKISAKAVIQQQYADEVLQGLRSMVSLASTATSSVTKFLGPASVGLTAFQTVSRIIAKQQQDKEGGPRHGSD